MINIVVNLESVLCMILEMLIFIQVVSRHVEKSCIIIIYVKRSQKLLFEPQFTTATIEFEVQAANTFTRTADSMSMSTSQI